MFMVVKIQIVFPEAAHYDHAARRPAVGEAGLAAPAAAAAGAGAVRHAAGTEVGVQRPEKRTGSEVRAAHRSHRGWRWACVEDREETLADNEEEESLSEVNMTRNIAECIET